MIQRRMNKPLLVILAFVMGLQHAHAFEVRTRPNHAPSTETEYMTFPISSEIQLYKVWHLVHDQKGLYVGLGSERSFRIASMMPNIEHLIQIDISEDVLTFCLINRELLKAPNRLRYQKLRWSDDFAQWERFMLASKEQGIDVRITKEDFDWWQLYVRNLDAMGYDLPERLYREGQAKDCEDSDINLGDVIDYQSGHYLFDDALYKTLHQLAINNRIEVISMDLSDDSEVEQLNLKIRSTGKRLAVLDLDNVFHPEYIGANAYLKAAQTLTRYGDDDSVFLMMANYLNFSCGQFQTYLGFEFAHVNTWEHFDGDDWFERLPMPALDLMDGRLVRKGQRLPLWDTSS